MTITIKSDKPEVIAAVLAVKSLIDGASRKVKDMQKRHEKELQELQTEFTLKETKAIQGVQFASGITQIKRYNVDDRYIEHGMVFFVRKEEDEKTQ